MTVCWPRWLRPGLGCAVWALLKLRPCGFPWLVVVGKRLTGWIVIDIDAPLITAHSEKAGAAVTFKKTFGHHPLAAWCANRGVPGDAAAARQRWEQHGRRPHPGADAGPQTVPGSSAAKILVRIDGAGATHDLLEHLEELNTTRL